MKTQTTSVDHSFIRSAIHFAKSLLSSGKLTGRYTERELEFDDWFISGYLDTTFFLHFPASYYNKGRGPADRKKSWDSMPVKITAEVVQNDDGTSRMWVTRTVGKVVKKSRTIQIYLDARGRLTNVARSEQKKVLLDGIRGDDIRESDHTFTDADKAFFIENLPASILR